MMRARSPVRGPHSSSSVSISCQLGSREPSVAAEGPEIAGLNGIAERAGDDLPFGIAGDGGDVRFKADGDDRDPAFERRFRDHGLIDRHQPVVERQTILLALLDRGRESFLDMGVDMAAERFKVALPECFEDHPVGRLRAFQETRDIEGRIGGKDRADTGPAVGT